MLRFRPGDAFAAEQVSFMELGETEGVETISRRPEVPRHLRALAAARAAER
jgi:hypothetical protein